MSCLQMRLVKACAKKTGRKACKAERRQRLEVAAMKVMAAKGLKTHN